MKIEEFRLELPELRLVARSKGLDRLKRVCSLLRGHPKARGERLLFLVAVIALDAIMIATGDVGARHVGRNWLDPRVQICYALLIVGGYVYSRICGLMDAARRLDARAEALPDSEFEEIAGMLACAPDFAQKDVQCGCYGCMKMLPPGEGRCATCGPRYAVYGDANHPLDEARLKRIHDLLLEGEDDV